MRVDARKTVESVFDKPLPTIDVAKLSRTEQDAYKAERSEEHTSELQSHLC